MKKNGSRKFCLAVAMCVVLIAFSVCYTETVPKLVLCGMATVIACVWMVCEARVDCAAAPLNLRVDKPPEGDDD